MAKTDSSRWFTLVQREVQEYKASLIWTPVIIAGALVSLMIVSILLSDRITVLGDTLLQVMLQEESVSGMSITINIDEDDGTTTVSLPDAPQPPAPEGAAGVPETPAWTIEEEREVVDEEDWNFSREWTFNPSTDKDEEGEVVERVESLNPVLGVLHNLLLVVLFVVTVHYLLGCLFNDRKDRSILFWKSMPVSEWEEVLAKLTVALLVAPLVYIAVSVITQLAYVLLAMWLVHRMELSPMEVIVDKIDFVPLFFHQISGWLLTALWIAPACGWLLLASAAARRSPFLLAVAPLIGLMILESIFLGSGFVENAIENHVPHVQDGGSTVGFYMYGPDWGAQNYLSLVLGLVFAAVTIAGAVYLRRYRFEI